MGYRQEDDEDQFGAPTDQATMGDMPDPAAQPSKVYVASYLKQKYGQAADMSGVQDARKKKAMADGIASIGEAALSHSTPGVTYLKGFGESGAPVKAANVNSNTDMSALRQYGDTQVANADKMRQAKMQANDMDNKFDEQGRQIVREDKQDARQDVQDKFSAEDQDQKRKGWDVTNKANDPNGVAANQSRLLLQSTLVQKSKAAREAGDPQAADDLIGQAKTAGQGMSAAEIMALHGQIKDLSYDDILNAKNKRAQIGYMQDLHQQGMDTKAEKEKTQLLGKLGDDFNVNKASSRAAIGVAAGKKMGAERLFNFAEVAPSELDAANADPKAKQALEARLDKLNPQQSAEIVTGLMSQLAPGSGSLGQFEHLKANTAEETKANILQYFTAHPQDANQGALILNNLRSINNEYKTSNAQISRHMGDIRAKNAELYKRFPDEAKAMDAHFVKGLADDSVAGGSAEKPAAAPQQMSAKALAPADQQAIDWANANPKDPRAAQILKLHGM